MKNCWSEMSQNESDDPVNLKANLLQNSKNYCKIPYQLFIYTNDVKTDSICISSTVIKFLVKRPKICTCCGVSEAKFYLYHNTKIAKTRPGFDDPPEYTSVQINYSIPWLGAT